MNYVCRDESLYSRRFSVTPVISQAMRITIYWKSRTNAYGTWEMQMLEWEEPAVHHASAVIDMPFL